MPRDEQDALGRPAAATKADRNTVDLRAAQRGLDYLNLLVAAVQTGFGPFIAVYLTSQGWTQAAIGVALSIGTIAAMASQVPAGALVDMVRRKTSVAGLSLLAFGASAVLFALWPTRPSIYLAAVLHGFSSSVLGPAIAAMSLAMVGQRALGPRLARNARYASIGNGLGAALMGICGYYISQRSVFFVTAALTLPALMALLPLSYLRHERPEPARGPPRAARLKHLAHVLADRRLVIFALCAMLFTFADAAMLPLAATALTRELARQASLLIAACIVLPQVLVALLSPWVARLADARGRRAALLLGFAMLPLRGLLFALIADPTVIVLIQLLDGVAGGCFGVLVPLVTSDVTGRSGHYNLSLGIVGLAIGIGGTLSTALAGWAAARFGDPVAFIGLACIGLAGTLLVWRSMPETRPAGLDAAVRSNP